MRVGKWFGLAVALAATGAMLFAMTRPPAVRVSSIYTGPIEQTILASGTVSPPAELKLGSLVSTTATQVFVKEGDLVVEGQILVELNSSEALAALDEAKARLSAAKAGRSELKTLSSPSAKASLEEAEANLLRAQKRVRREETLHTSGVSTDVELEDAQNTLALAQAQRTAAVLQVQAASRGGSQSLATEATIAQAQAQLKSAEERLRQHTIIAPSAGVVLNRSVEPGDAVAAGSLLILLSRAGQTRLIIEPDERVLGLVRPGQTARASTEAFPDKSFAAVVSSIAPAVDPKRGTIEVELLVDTPPEYLRPHMTTSVEISVAEKSESQAVPTTSILDPRGQPAVLTVKDGKLQRLPVKLGIRGEDKVEVLAGLDLNAQVVTFPQGLVLGTRVQAEQAASTSTVEPR